MTSYARSFGPEAAGLAFDILHDGTNFTVTATHGSLAPGAPRSSYGDTSDETFTGPPQTQIGAGSALNMNATATTRDEGAAARPGRCSPSGASPAADFVIV